MGELNKDRVPSTPAPPEKAGALNGTQSGENVGDDAHIVPQSHKTAAVR